MTCFDFGVTFESTRTFGSKQLLSRARKEVREGKKSNFALHINDIRHERENKRLILSKRRRRAWVSMRAQFNSNIILKNIVNLHANVLSANDNGMNFCIRTVYNLIKLTTFNLYLTKGVGNELIYLHRGKYFSKNYKSTNALL